MTKLIAVVGGKHSGKTTVIEHLIVELKRRGFRVGAIKEMGRVSTLDTPATETDRYTQAGAETIVAIPRTETVIFVKRRLALKEILPFLSGLDFVLLECFESAGQLPKILTAKTVAGVQSSLDSLVMAVSGIVATLEPERNALESALPVINAASQVGALADLVEKKAVEPQL